LNELFEAHIGKWKRRQIEEVAAVSVALYDGYKIITGLFRGNNDEIIHRLKESKTFQKLFKNIKKN